MHALGYEPAWYTDEEFARFRTALIDAVLPRRGEAVQLFVGELDRLRVGLHPQILERRMTAITRFERDPLGVAPSDARFAVYYDVAMTPWPELLRRWRQLDPEQVVRVWQAVRVMWGARGAETLTGKRLAAPPVEFLDSVAQELVGAGGDGAVHNRVVDARTAPDARRVGAVSGVAGPTKV